MIIKDYSILIGGEAGEGSKKAGLIIAKFFSRYGYQIFIYEDYQSLIRGGHNFSLIRASSKKVLSSRNDLNFLLALNQDTVERHKEKLKDKNNILYNSDRFSLKEGKGVPIESITKKFSGIPIMKNTALVAAFGKIAGIDWNTVRKVLKDELPISTELNLKIAKSAYDAVDSRLKIKKISSSPKPLLSGNEAMALGALNAGLEAYVAYPMTPTTGILNYLASVALENRLIVFQPENEIAVINAAVGLSFSGKKTMVGTSGGGFCLMNEGVSLAGQAEIPLVIIEGQRLGPSSGGPTYGGQSDLLHVLSSGHGDFVRFVTAPGDAEEAFYLAGLSLNISWKYQIPSIILSDKEICENTVSFDEESIKKVLAGKTELWNGKGQYLRYKITENGISPLAFPGNGKATVKGSSYEHDEAGIAVEDEESIKKMQDKRLKKYSFLKKKIDKMKCVNVYGDKKSRKAIIVWGSVKGAAIEASDSLGIKVIQPMVFQPFPEKEIKKHLKEIDQLISIESNSTGQMAQVLRRFGIKIDKMILKYDGRPFTASEIINKMKQYG